MSRLVADMHAQITHDSRIDLLREQYNSGKKFNSKERISSMTSEEQQMYINNNK